MLTGREKIEYQAKERSIIKKFRIGTLSQRDLVKQLKELNKIHLDKLFR